MYKKKLIQWIRKYFIIPVLLFPIMLESCVTHRNLVYMKNGTLPPAEYTDPEYSDYLLKPNDALYINVNSIDDISSNIFAQPGSDGGRIDAYGAYMNSYTISKGGYVQLPVIGKIYVAEKTTAEVSEMIKEAAANILNQPVVVVRLVNQYVSVLGEVYAPGHYVYAQDKFTVFDAISMAGDITPYGNRKKVVLTRNENGYNIQKELDLSSPTILSSEFYYVKPNDMIYVKPLRKRIWGMEAFPFELIFSSLSTGLLIYTIFFMEQSQ